MAIALVGSLGALQSGASPLQAAFGQTTTAGNLLVGWAGHGAQQVATIDQGWTEILASSLNVHLYYKANCGTGETAPSLTFAGSSYDFRVAEFSGAATTTPLEGSQEGGTTSPTTVTIAAADAAAGNLLIAATGTVTSKAGTTTTTLTFNNATATDAGNIDTTSTTVHYRFSYGVTTTNAGADSTTATDSDMNLTNMVALIGSFKASGAAAAFQPRPTGSTFQDPAVFMGAIKRRWDRRRSGLFIPEYVF